MFGSGHYFTSAAGRCSAALATAVLAVTIIAASAPSTRTAWAMKPPSAADRISASANRAKASAARSRSQMQSARSRSPAPSRRPSANHAAPSRPSPRAAAARPSMRASRPPSASIRSNPTATRSRSAAARPTPSFDRRSITAPHRPAASARHPSRAVGSPTASLDRLRSMAAEQSSRARRPATVARPPSTRNRGPAATITRPPSSTVRSGRAIQPYVRPDNRSATSISDIRDRLRSQAGPSATARRGSPTSTRAAAVAKPPTKSPTSVAKSHAAPGDRPTLSQIRDRLRSQQASARPPAASARARANPTVAAKTHGKGPAKTVRPHETPGTRPSFSELRRRLDVQTGSLRKTMPGRPATPGRTGLAGAPGKGPAKTARPHETPGTRSPSRADLKSHFPNRPNHSPTLSDIRGRIAHPKGMAGKGPAASRSRTAGRASYEAVGRARVQFASRYQSGQLKHVTTGHVAKQLRLSEQYRALQKGDVARRLHLHDHVAKIPGHNSPGHGRHAGFHPSHSRYHGRISPHYTQSSFRFHYHGHHHFAGLRWYPRWTHWVNWSWHYHMPPTWDPRPVWCRPVIYQPYAHWTWYVPPVWVPLPVVASGTWVDVAPAAVAPEQLDVQLLAVRFVDPGHPDESLGPRYRVWFRNNSDLAITKPFDVMLVAGSDEELVRELPSMGVRVTSMKAGEVQSVDIRLPIAVNSMARDSQGQPAPFETLHVLVDANRDLPESAEENNGARIPRGEVFPVDPATFEAEPARAAAGTEVILAGEGFGPEPGQVLVHLAGLELEAEILGWYDLGVRLALPMLPLAGPANAEVIVVRGDGAAANPLKITVTPPAAPAPVEVVPPGFPQ